LTNKLYYIS